MRTPEVDSESMAADGYDSTVRLHCFDISAGVGPVDGEDDRIAPQLDLSLAAGIPQVLEKGLWLPEFNDYQRRL